MELDWKTVIAQYEAIRRLGQTNMFDTNMVQRIAVENDFHDLVSAIEDVGYANILTKYKTVIETITDDEVPTARRVE